ncbi:MAG: outer membrane lipid asymmetry maintenance protein MlaD [Alphaproteobacteria bacterium]|nr:outer membrane lipid asymmetry maintenance protein MlaD [Alphaproteobacteria bacterium]
MQDNLVETLIGGAVIAIAGLFLFFAYQTVDAGHTGGYILKARFDRVDGIALGADVRLAGIKIGTVSALSLDQKTYLADVELAVDKGVMLPEDSSVKITSEGLLGGSYLAIEPGGSDVMLANGGEITNTQGSIDLMSLIGRAVFGAGESSGTAEPSTPPAQP